jgi:peptide/nickel transport system substrate-binding protein
MNDQRLSRRQFLRASALMATGIIVSACAPSAPSPTTKPADTPVVPVAPAATSLPITQPTVARTAATKVSTGYQESPALADLVKAGKLPPVSDRLPKEPLVLPVREALGRYGGVIRHVGDRQTPGFLGFRIGHALLSHGWGLRGGLTEIMPNIAKSFKANASMTQMTLQLREGLKWSDGQPFTAEDMEFYWKNVLMNDKLTPGKPTQLRNKGGGLMQFKVLSPYEVEFIADASQPFFWDYLAGPTGFTQYPKHYMKQFHPDFVAEKDLEDLAKKEGLANWMQLFGARAGDMLAGTMVEKPRLIPWIPKRLPPETPPWIWGRNPYYWAVDEQGNQLPYIDAIHHSMAAREVAELKALAGETDFNHILNALLLPDLLQAEKEGKLRMNFWYIAHTSNVVLFFNMNAKDEALRGIFRDKRFRMAVSHAVDREEINQLLFFGRCEPQQPMPLRGSPQWEATKHVATLYTEFDQTKANQLLDEMGLDKKNSAGWRLRPDGQELFLEFCCYGWKPETELIVDHLQTVGLHAEMKYLDSALFWQRRDAVDLDCVSIGGYLHAPDLTVSPQTWVPNATGSFAWPAYGLWYSSGGKSGEEPTGKAKENLDKWVEMMGEPDAAKRLELQKQIILTAVEDLWGIGMLFPSERYVATSSKLMNISRKDFIRSWSVDADADRPETYFYAE